MKPNSNDSGFDIHPVHLGFMVDKANLNHFLCSHKTGIVHYMDRTAVPDFKNSFRNC